VATVELKFRIVDSRQAFGASTVLAWLELPSGTSAGMTRGHKSWYIAAAAALALAKRRGLSVSNEAPVLARIATELADTRRERGEG
jgi:hypothetical protein